MHHVSRFIVPLGLIALLLCGLPANADWNQWRGPTRDGVVKDANWPDQLDKQVLKEVWHVELAEGYPGPIIAGGMVFTASTKNMKTEVVRAFDRLTGKPLWEASWPGAMKVPFFARRNGSWMKSTPASDGKNLYVIGMTDELVCLDMKTGKETWRVDFKKRYGTQIPSFGQPCSPLLDGDALYIQAGMSVCKLDKKTGKTLWRTLVDQRAMMGGAFSSPIIAKVAGKRQLLVQTRSELCGVDLETGKALWRQSIKAFRGMNIVPPTVVNDKDVFTASYGGGSFMVRVTKDDAGKFAAKILWQKPKIEGYMSSPILHDGHLYLHRRDKLFCCIEAATGDVKWTSKQKFGEYWSSAVSGDKLLALDQTGTLRLIRMTPKQLDIIAEQKVSDQETWGHLAVDGDLLYIRELKGLRVFRWAKAKPFN